MDSKKLTIFVLLAVVLMFGWELLMDRMYPERKAQRMAASIPVTASAPAAASGAAGVANAPVDAGRLVQGQRISVTTDLFAAEIDTNGADLRKVNLLQHGEAGNSKQPFQLLMDGQERISVAQTGLIGQDPLLSGAYE